MLAVIYDRASSQAQAGNWSRTDAEATGLGLAKRHGFEQVDLRIEIKSGEELLNRPVIKKILEDIEAGLVQAIA
jgi:DNA invertase Pin-like site-specific DNA recombinase